MHALHLISTWLLVAYIPLIWFAGCAIDHLKKPDPSKALHADGSVSTTQINEKRTR